MRCLHVHQLDLPPDISLAIAFLKNNESVDQCSVFTGVILKSDPFGDNSTGKCIGK